MSREGRAAGGIGRCRVSEISRRTVLAGEKRSACHLATQRGEGNRQRRDHEILVSMPPAAAINPDIFVAAIVVFQAGAVRYERDGAGRRATIAGRCRSNRRRK